MAVIEHTTFQLAPGIDEASFLAADERVQSEVSMFLPGFVRRTTARHEDGTWLIEIMWGSMDDAIAASVNSDEATLALARTMDPSTVTVQRYTTLD